MSDRYECQVSCTLCPNTPQLEAYVQCLLTFHLPNKYLRKESQGCREPYYGPQCALHHLQFVSQSAYSTFEIQASPQLQTAESDMCAVQSKLWGQGGSVVSRGLECASAELVLSIECRGGNCRPLYGVECRYYSTCPSRHHSCDKIMGP